MSARSWFVPFLVLLLLGDNSWGSGTKITEVIGKLRASRGKPSDPPASVLATNETYNVGAQYRATIKKSFKELGFGELECKTLGPDKFSVRLIGKVKPPDKTDLLEFDIYREFRMDGSKVVKVVERDRLNAAAAEHKRKLVDTVSLVYLVKWRTPRADDKARDPLTFTVDGRSYTVTYQIASRWLETTVRDDAGPIARFFLKPHEGGVRPVTKFWIYAKNRLVVSFSPASTNN